METTDAIVIASGQGGIFLAADFAKEPCHKNPLFKRQPNKD
jgi:hypothetical protein